MAITFIGSGSAEAATVALGAHQKGDLVIGYAYRHDSSIEPRPASSRWHTLLIGNTATSSHTLSYMICESNSEVFGTWTNVTSVGYLIYRSSNIIYPTRPGVVNNLQDGASGPLSTNTVAYAVQTLLRNSWVVGVGGIRTIDTDINTPPAGMVNRVSRVGASAGHLVMHDTDGEVASWATTNVTITGTTTSWRSQTIILLETNVPVAAATSLTPRLTSRNIFNVGPQLIGNNSLLG